MFRTIHHKEFHLYEKQTPAGHDSVSCEIRSHLVDPPVNGRPSVANYLFCMPDRFPHHVILYNRYLMPKSVSSGERHAGENSEGGFSRIMRPKQGDLILGEH